jgi:3-oxoadipate enol-lactonase
MFGPDTLRERPEIVDEFTRTANGYLRDGIARAAKAVVVRRTSVVADLGKITAPTLVMCGRDDRATTPDRSEQIARGIRGARLVQIDRSGHMSAIERPQAVNAELVPFVAAQLA